jgi:hypothetical protein
MELDEAHQVPQSKVNSNFAPVEPAFSPAMDLDDPQAAASKFSTTTGASLSMLTITGVVPNSNSAMELDGAQPTASKPTAAFGASISMPTATGNASPFAFKFSQGSATSTANHARPAGGSTMPTWGSSQTSALPNAQTGQKVSRKQSVPEGFRDRSENSRKEIDRCMDQVPEQYKIDVHKVREAKVCDETPAPSSGIATSIPELANMGPGARVIPPPRREQVLTHDQARDALRYFKGVRAENGQVWLDLITAILQSGRTPKETFSDDCSKILDTEWVIDYARLDKIARKTTDGQDAFFTPENIHPAHRPLFDEAFRVVMSGGGRIFDQAVAKWSLGGNSPGENKGLIMQCLERAGWIRADSEMTRFMKWSLDASLSPLPIRRACNCHFKWAFPRLLHAVSSERIDLGLPGPVHT